MIIYIKPLKGPNIQLEVDSDTTVLQVKQMLEQQTGTPVKAQRLILNGIEIPVDSDGSRIVEDFHLQNATIIQFMVRPAAEAESNVTPQESAMSAVPRQWAQNPDPSSKPAASDPLAEIKAFRDKLVLSFPEDLPSKTNIRALMTLVSSIENGTKPVKFAVIEAQRWMQKMGDYNSTIDGMLNKLKGDTPSATNEGQVLK